MTKVYRQQNQFSSPWSISQRLKLLLWEIVWNLFCYWTPKPANFWRIYWLKMFGAQIKGRPFVHQRARIQVPWNLVLHHRACLGDRAVAYSLGKIIIGEFATVAQEVYLCTGTHDFEDTMNLITKPIKIEAYAFVGARAFVLPGICIGRGAIVGASSLVAKDVLSNTIVAGNPAKFIKNVKKKQCLAQG